MNFGTVERGTPLYIQNPVPEGSYVLFGRVPTRSNSKTDAESQGVKPDSCSKTCSIGMLLGEEQPMKNSQSPFHSKRDSKSHEKHDRRLRGCEHEKFGDNSGTVQNDNL